MKRRYGYGIAGGVDRDRAGGDARRAAAGWRSGDGLVQGMGQGMRGQGMGPGGPGGGPMAALKLTAEQQQKLQALMQTEREAHQAAMEQVRELRTQLHQALYGGETPDQEGVDAGERNRRPSRRRSAFRMQMAAAAVLTPEQRKILLESGMEFPPARMGPGGPGGRGGRGTGLRS